MPECVHVQCLQKSEEGINHPLELKLPVTVSRHVGAGSSAKRPSALTISVNHVPRFFTPF